jgi:hypothetical protein
MFELLVDLLADGILRGNLLVAEQPIDDEARRPSFL